MQKKNIWVIGALLVALTISNVEAGKDKLYKRNRKDDRPLTLTEQVYNYVQYPAFAMQRNIEGVVRLSYVINERNQLRVMEIHCANKELEAYVREQIDGKIVADPSSDHTTVKYLKLRFELTD